MDDNSQVHYIKTKRQSIVSPRDQNLVINRRVIQPKDSPTGNKIFIIGARSYDFEKYPEKSGIVRANTYITGYYIEEIAKNQCDVHFLLETDYKIPVRIQRLLGPKSTNYAWSLKKYIEKRKEEMNL